MINIDKKRKNINLFITLHQCGQLGRYEKTYGFNMYLTIYLLENRADNSKNIALLLAVFYWRLLVAAEASS